MANAVYPEYKQSLLGGDANTALTGSGATGLYVALVDTGTYTYSAAHQFYSDLSGVVGTDQEIGSVTYANGLVDGDAVTWTSVSGNSAEALVFYRKNAGANTTWRLVAYIDSGQTGMAVTPNGGDITYTPSASGIFQL
jgi:uncharacterized glyoxalase superfamily protein PhnB